MGEEAEERLEWRRKFTDCEKERENISNVAPKVSEAGLPQWGVCSCLSPHYNLPPRSPLKPNKPRPLHYERPHSKESLFFNLTLFLESYFLFYKIKRLCSPGADPSTFSSRRRLSVSLPPPPRGGAGAEAERSLSET